MAIYWKVCYNSNLPQRDCIAGLNRKGIGNSINDTTGTKAAGDGLQGVTGGIEDGANSAGKGAENAVCTNNVMICWFGR
ncbi:hypothetical protein LTS10_000645 [Elasticomyces elasticus]|nr:hypothetical protein LTS10_000645 [Elasticomyces elasticus]